MIESICGSWAIPYLTYDSKTSYFARSRPHMTTFASNNDLIPNFNLRISRRPYWLLTATGCLAMSVPPKLLAQGPLCGPMPRISSATSVDSMGI